MEPTIEQIKLRLLALDDNKQAKCCTYTVGSYNERRYSKPWIAKITSWPVGRYPVLSFGSSSTSEAEISANVGDILKAGQKDHRNPVRSDNDFYIVDQSGGLQRLTENQAKVLFRASIEDLLSRINKAVESSVAIDSIN